MIALSLDGVLRQPHSQSSIPAGVALYRALVEKAGLALVTDGGDEAALEHWLRSNNLVDHDYLILRRLTDPEEPGRRRVEQLNRLRTAGPVDLLVEADPEAARAAVADGVPTMYFVHPAYARPEHLPGDRRLPTPWAALLDEEQRQQDIKTNDTRLTQEIL